MKLYFQSQLSLTLLPIVHTLYCYSGHFDTQHKCTSQSYCVIVKSRNGLIQRSCDGNSLAHISLCALSPARRRIVNGDFMYSSGVTEKTAHLAGAPTHQHSRMGRHPPPDMNCFNGGDIGEVCCCSTDFCNSSNLLRWTALLLVTVFLLLT